MLHYAGAAEGIEMWCGKWKNRQLYNLSEFTLNQTVTRSVFQITHAMGNRTHMELFAQLELRRAGSRSVQLCCSLVGRRPRPFAEVSRADRSHKSGVALPKRETCGMAFAIPAIPSPPPMNMCMCKTILLGSVVLKFAHVTR